MLSVAICTYKRASLLNHVLDSVARQSLAKDQFEIVIVDNGSTDRTREVVAAAQMKDSRIRYVVEPKAGIAHARNRALQEARGENLAFIDDDAWADPKWLENLIAPLRSISPTPECIAGPVSLVWDGRRPDWFPDRFESLLCRYDMGDAPHFLSADGYLLTTNSLFHRKTLLRLGGMRTDLGHKRKSLLGGEDNDIFKRLIANGHRVYYQPTAHVNHPVPKERQTHRFLLRRLFWDGASQPLFERGSVANQRSSFSALAELYKDGRRLARFAFEASAGTLRREPAIAKDAVYRLVQRAGRMRTHLLMVV